MRGLTFSASFDGPSFHQHLGRSYPLHRPLDHMSRMQRAQSRSPDLEIGRRRHPAPQSASSCPVLHRLWVEPSRAAAHVLQELLVSVRYSALLGLAPSLNEL